MQVINTNQQIASKQKLVLPNNFVGNIITNMGAFFAFIQECDYGLYMSCGQNKGKLKIIIDTP